MATEINISHGRCIVDWHVSPCKILFLQFCKCTKKLLLGNLMVVNRIFFGRLQAKYMQYCHSFIFHVFVLLIKFFWLYQLYYFSIFFFRFAVYCFTNTVSNVRVSLREKTKFFGYQSFFESSLKESIDFRVITEW